jgi:5-methylcytosine-specific restriction endonuclease McrA
MRRAVALIFLDKAEPLEVNGFLVRSERRSIRAPSVVRLCHFVRRPLPELKLTRASIFARDNHSCQYCGRRGGGLTIDHVIPRARGGRYGWANLVTCCLKCNNKKGNRTPQEALMRLLRQPRRPRYTPYISLPRFLEAYRADRWSKYLQPFIDYAGLTAAE